MARNRMIRPEFWEDTKMAQLSAFGRLFYIALWNFADDEGYLEHNPLWLKAKCFPYDKVNIDKLIDELKECGRIQIQNGIIFIVNFAKYQKVEKPKESELSGTFSDTSGNSRGEVGELSDTKEKLREVKRREDTLYADFEQSAITAWNSFCDSFPALAKVKEVSGKRRDKLKKRFEQKSFREFDKILAAIKEQPFLRGSNDRKWKVSFDWLIENDTNYLKVLEKRYVNTNAQQYDTSHLYGEEKNAVNA